MHAKRMLIASLLCLYLDGVAWTAPPYSPEEAARQFILDESLTIELVAGEPAVQDPVAVAWDAAGQMFVVEMGDYPALESGGRIRRLIDKDRDGTYETSSLFAEGLHYPTSVLPWKGGILVAAAPDILYLEDSDGDGRADIRRPLITGFGEGNQQLRVNGLTYGLDNWIYGANGRSNGNIHFTANSSMSPLPLANHDFRFSLENPRVELTAGFSQFGVAFDDWGDQFLSWNTIPLRHVVIEQRYLNRNPYLLGANGVHDIADPADAGRIFASTAPQPRFNREPTGYFNASCGITIDRGGLFTGDLRGSAFVCEPLGNIVHRKVLQPDGPTFLGKRSPNEASSEFLASRDPWFHPVNLASGPDGALYVIDFYREWVEHPQFVPDDLEADIDFAFGKGHGRIWRIRPKQFERPITANLATLPADQLLPLLASPIGWQRMTAQRILIERADRSLADALRKMIANHPEPVGRLHALWTASGLGILEVPTLIIAFGDDHPEVRRAAVKIAETAFLSAEPIRQKILTLAEDSSLRVRFQVACTLGDLPDSQAQHALAKIASRDGDDPWMRQAVLTSIGNAAVPFLRVFCAHGVDNASAVDFAQAIGLMIGVANQPDQLASLFEWLPQTEPAIAAAIFLGLGEGLHHRGVKLNEVSAVPPILSPLLVRARGEACDTTLSVPQRLRATRLIAYDESSAAITTLTGALRDPDLAIRQAAVQSLGNRSDAPVVSSLLAAWEDSASSVRREIAAALVRSPQRAVALLDALEAKQIQRNDLDLDCRQQLLRNLPESERDRANHLLQGDANADRKAVIDRYRNDALQAAGDSRRGETHFAKNCASCHRIRGKGPLVGPELSGLVTKTPEQLLVDILDPSREVLPNFIGFVAVTKDGDLHSGLLGAETPTSITLRKQEGADQRLLREEIEELRATGKSLMPEGFEQNLSPTDIADLIAFLREIQR